jgi:hypothetical protein
VVMIPVTLYVPLLEEPQIRFGEHRRMAFKTVVGAEIERLRATMAEKMSKPKKAADAGKRWKTPRLFARDVLGQLQGVEQCRRELAQHPGCTATSSSMLLLAHEAANYLRAPPGWAPRRRASQPWVAEGKGVGHQHGGGVIGADQVSDDRLYVGARKALLKYVKGPPSSWPAGRSGRVCRRHRHRLYHL